MGIKEKMMEGLMNETMQSLGKVLESIHCHLEIIARETIKTRLEMRKTDVTDEEIEDIIHQYEERLA